MSKDATPAAPKRQPLKRQAWTLVCQKMEGDTLQVRPVVVLAPTFKAGALKAARWQTENSEWQIASFTLQQDTVI